MTIHSKAMLVWNTWISKKKKDAVYILMDYDEDMIDVLNYIREDLNLPDLAWTLAIKVIEKQEQ